MPNEQGVAEQALPILLVALDDRMPEVLAHDAMRGKVEACRDQSVDFSLDF
jgi:hypothetical protein